MKNIFVFCVLYLFFSNSALARDCPCIMGKRSESSWLIWKEIDLYTPYIDRVMKDIHEKYSSFPSDDEARRKFIADPDNKGKDWHEEYTLARQRETASIEQEITDLGNIVGVFLAQLDGSPDKRFGECLKQNILDALKNLPEKSSYPVGKHYLISRAVKIGEFPFENPITTQDSNGKIKGTHR